MTDPEERAAPEPPSRQLLRAVVQEALDEAATPGAAVALLIDGRSAFVAGVGARDLYGATPLDLDARCYIYSITKPLLATVALQLVAEGRLALDTFIQTYLLDLPLAAPATLRELLNHTGGFPDYGGMPEYRVALTADPTRPWTTDEFLARTLPRGPLFVPGEGWAYSNLGYLIVRMAIERVTGAALGDVLRRRLFAPLGLQNTFVAETLADAATLTPGHSTLLDPAGRLTDVTRRYHPGWVAHGVVISTAPELARLVEALFTGDLLPPPLLATMLAPTPVPGGHPLFRQTAYGLGVMLDPRSPHGLVAGHGGEGPGYSAAALHFPDVSGRRVTGVALANRDRHDLGLRIVFALARALDEDTAR